MTGFEGIGDFNSNDPYERYLAHQAAKGNLPYKVLGKRENTKCPNCGRVMSFREEDEQGQCNDCAEGLIPPQR